MFQFLRNISQRLIHIWEHRVSAKVLPLLSLVTVTGLILAAIALWSFAEIAEEVLEKETLGFDRAILLAIYQFHSPLLDQVMLGITFLGDPTVLAILSMGLGVVLVARRHWLELIILVIAAGGAMGLNFLLKDVFARARPQLWDRVLDVTYYSFPSGHAMISLVIYGLLGYWLARQFRGWRPLIGTVVLLLIAAIGLSRLYLGVHWPTDVVAGYAAGLVWLMTCILGLEVSNQHQRLHSSSYSG